MWKMFCYNAKKLTRNDLLFVWHLFVCHLCDKFVYHLFVCHLYGICLSGRVCIALQITPENLGLKCTEALAGS